MKDASFIRSHAFVACLLTVLIVGALGMVACGGSGSTTAAPSATPSTTPVATSPSPVAWASARPAVSYSIAEPPSTGRPSPHLSRRVDDAGTIGWSFTPEVGMKVVKLGCFAAGRDGLARSHRVGMFEHSSGKLLASVIVRPQSRLHRYFRWESLETPLTLQAGLTYVVGTEDKRTLETVYSPHEWPSEGDGPPGEHWADEIYHFGTWMLVSRPSETAFTVPTLTEDLWGFPPFYSPNFEFKPASAAPQAFSDADLGQPAESSLSAAPVAASPVPTASASAGSQREGLVWKIDTGAAVESTPAASRGVVYIGNSAGHLYAVDLQSGRQRWAFQTGGATHGPIRSALAVADGAVYCRSDDGYLHAVDIQSGREMWKSRADGGGSSSPAVGGGMVYLASPSASDHHGDDLYALDGASGRVIWRATVKWKLAKGDVPTNITSPAVSDGVVYYAAGGILYALDGATGERLWRSDPRLAPSCAMSGTPAVAHGLVYTRVPGNWPVSRLVAWNAKSGKWRWVSRIVCQEPMARFTSPAVGDGVVYVTRGDGTVVALDGQSGRERWNSRKGLAGGATPVVLDGLVCVGGDDGWLHALDADTGRIAWTFKTGSGALTSPVVSNGMVCVGSDDGCLYVVK